MMPQCLSQKKPNNEKYTANVFYNGPAYWNKLPVHIQNIET